VKQPKPNTGDVCGWAYYPIGVEVFFPLWPSNAVFQWIEERFRKLMKREWKQQVLAL
jgi:flavin-dependent dehydrogenase